MTAAAKHITETWTVRGLDPRAYRTGFADAFGLSVETVDAIIAAIPDLPSATPDSLRTGRLDAKRRDGYCDSSAARAWATAADRLHDED